jgi:hypothetical protein
MNRAYTRIQENYTIRIKSTLQPQQLNKSQASSIVGPFQYWQM